MAIGLTATQLTGANALANLNTQLGQDAVYMRQFCDWLKRKSAEYTVNIGSAAALQAAPYSMTSGDANAAMVLVGDLARLITYFEGTLPVASNVVNNMAAALGVGT